MMRDRSLMVMTSQKGAWATAPTARNPRPAQQLSHVPCSFRAASMHLLSAGNHPLFTLVSTARPHACFQPSSSAVEGHGSWRRLRQDLGVFSTSFADATSRPSALRTVQLSELSLAVCCINDTPTPQVSAYVLPIFQSCMSSVSSELFTFIPAAHELARLAQGNGTPSLLVIRIAER